MALLEIFIFSLGSYNYTIHVKTYFLIMLKEITISQIEYFSSVFLIITFKIFLTSKVMSFSIFFETNYSILHSTLKLNYFEHKN